MSAEQIEKRSWHIGKEIPIATIIVLIFQTCGVIWWAASTSARVDFLKETITADRIAQTTIEKRQDDDARRMEERISTQLEKVNAKLDRLIESRK